VLLLKSSLLRSLLDWALAHMFLPSLQGIW
jgi:hypothetical protein